MTYLQELIVAFVYNHFVCTKEDSHNDTHFQLYVYSNSFHEDTNHHPCEFSALSLVMQENFSSLTLIQSRNLSEYQSLEPSYSYHA